jgi:hypothetical protein
VSDQTKPRAIVRVTRHQVEVSCRFGGHKVPVDSAKDQQTQISSAVFAHERACGKCDTGPAYAKGSPAFARDVEVARSAQDQIDEKQAVQEASRIVDE